MSQVDISRQQSRTPWALLWSALLVLGSTLVAWSYDDHRRTALDAEYSLKFRATSAASDIERTLQSITAALNSIHADGRSILVGKRGLEFAGQHMKVLSDSLDGVRTLSLFDARGTVVASSRPELVNQNFAERAYFQLALKEKDPARLYLSEPFQISLEVYAITMVRSILGVDGEFLGIAAATLEPSDFKQTLEGFSEFPDSFASIVHGAGGVFVFTPAATPMPANDDQRMVATSTLRPESLNMDHALTVSVSRDVDQIFIQWRKQALLMAAFFLGLTLLSTLGLGSYQRRMRVLNESHALLRQQAQEKERWTFSLLNATGQIAHVGGWSLDAASRALTWTDEVYRIYELPLDTPLSVDIALGFYGPEHRSHLRAAFASALDHGKPFELELELDTLGGRRIWVHAQGICEVDAVTGKTLRVFGAFQDISAAKFSALHLRYSEARFAAFFDGSMVGMATMSINKDWIKINPAMCRILGYSIQDLIFKTWADIAHPEDLDALLNSFESTLMGAADQFSLETRFVRPHSDTVYTIMAVSAVRNSNHEIDFLAVVLEDISLRKLAEQKMRSALQLTQSFLEHFPGMAYIKDKNSTVLMANRGFELIGLNPELMIGKNSLELLPAPLGERVMADDRRVLENGGFELIEEEFAGRNFESSKFVIQDEQGERLLGGITMDVTARHRHIRLTQALLEINELGSQLAEKSFLTKGLELAEQLTNSGIGFLHFVNDDQETLELVTWTTNALKGCTAVHDSHYPISQAGIWADCFRQKRPAVFNDYAGHTQKQGLPKGHAPLHRLISVPVIEGGVVRMMMGVGNKPTNYEDIDVQALQLIGNDLWRVARRKRVEMQLQQRIAELGALNARLTDTQGQLMQSEKLSAIGQLAAGIAHEINNPVGFVYSNMSTLSDYVNDLLAIDSLYSEMEDQVAGIAPELVERARALKLACDHAFVVSDLRQLLRESTEGLERVKTIVQDLKDFSRTGETGWDWADLHKGLQSTLNIVRNEIKYKAEIVQDLGTLPLVRCIPAQINQVFMNLLVNAAQAIVSRGQITLRSGVDGEFVWLTVQDDGCGIAPDKLKRIFEPFYTSKPVGKGTGLGLALAWGIMQRHQGAIEVQSTPGKGSCFTVRLPMAGPAVAADVQPPKEVEQL